LSAGNAAYLVSHGMETINSKMSDAIIDYDDQQFHKMVQSSADQSWYEESI